MLHRLADGGAQRARLRRLVDVSHAPAATPGGGCRRLVRRQHDHLDVRFQGFEPLQQLDARIPACGCSSRPRQCRFALPARWRQPVPGHEHIVFVLENHAHALTEEVLVVHVNSFRDAVQRQVCNFFHAAGLLRAAAISLWSVRCSITLLTAGTHGRDFVGLGDVIRCPQPQRWRMQSVVS